MDLVRSVKRDISMETGIVFDDMVDAKEVDTGWKLAINYRSLLSQSIKIKLTIDVTKTENEKILTDVKKRSLIHDYSDPCPATLTTYSLEEITAEKLRALCDRAWPRDLYDVHNLWPRIERSNFGVLFLKKCRYRGLYPTVGSYRGNKEKLRNAWISSLEHQLKDVPDFEHAFEDVLGIFESVGID